MSVDVELPIALGRKGYHVLPLLVREDGSKQPLSKWSTEATADPDKIRALNWDDATHIAVACEPSGIVVVDIDPFYDDEEDLRVEGVELLNEWLDLASAHGESDPAVLDPPWVTTYSEGVHVFLRADPDKPMTNSIKDVTHCIDIRGVGGIVAIYADPDEMPDPGSFPPVPEWLYELAKRESEHLTPLAPPRPPEFNENEAGTAYGLKAQEGEHKAIRDAWDADEGNFNKILNRSAYAIGQLVGGGQLDYDDAYQELRDLLLDLGAPGSQYKSLDSGFVSGYQRPREIHKVVITDEALTEMSESWLSAGELDRYPPPRWLIPGWLEFDSVAQLYGSPKTGKSFIGLDVAARLSRGLGWPTAGNTIDQPVKVAYIIAEGVAGFVQRKKSWEHVHGPMGEIRFYPKAIQVRSKEWDIAIEYLAQWKPGLVIVDTQARCTIGMDENNPQSVNQVYPKLDEMRERTGACVLLIHHTNKEGASARGSNAMLANINTEIRLSKSYGRIKVRNSAQKNQEEANDVYFTLEPALDSVVPHLSIEVPSDMADKIQNNHSHLQVRQHLESHQDIPQTTNDLLEATGLAKSNLHKTLKAMLESEQITKSTVYRNNRNQSAYTWAVSPDGGG